MYKVNRSSFISILLYFFSSFTGNHLIAYADEIPTVSEPERPTPTIQKEENSEDMLETYRRQRREREVQRMKTLAPRFIEKFGYNPLDYILEFTLAGSNITVFNASYWMIFEVKPSEGIIKVKHQTVTRDIFWGTFQYFPHEALSVKFKLDPEACKIFADGVNCELIGNNSIELPIFMSNHQLIKYGEWEVTFIESGQQITDKFRVPMNILPRGTYQGVTMEEINTSFCQTFPGGLSCQK